MVIKNRDIKIDHYPKGNNWDAVEFNIINPTSSNIDVNLFDGNVLSLTPSEPYPDGAYPSNVEPTFSVSLQNFGLVYLSTTNKIYVGNAMSSPYTINILNANTNTVVNTITYVTGTTMSLGVYCSALHRVYFIGIGGAGSTVTVIDCATESIIATITTPQIGQLEGIAYCSSKNTVYVTLPDKEFIYEIDCDTNTVISSISAPFTSLISGCVYNSVNDSLYIVDTNLNNVYELSCSSNSITDTISTVSKPYGTIVYNSTKNSVYFTVTGGSAGLREIDCSTNILSAFALSTIGNTYGYAVIDDLNYLYIANYSGLSTDGIVILDCSNNTVVETVDVSFNNAALGQLVYVPFKKSVYGTKASAISNLMLELSTTKQLYITGSVSYNQWLQDCFINPKQIRQIFVISDRTSQMAIPFDVVWKDANGQQVGYLKFPNTNISTNWFQNNYSIIDFEKMELVLDNNTVFSQYEVEADTSVRLIIYYQEVTRASILSAGLNDKKDKVIWMENMPDVDIKSEDDLNLFRNGISVDSKFLKPYMKNLLEKEKFIN